MKIRNSSLEMDVFLEVKLLIPEKSSLSNLTGKNGTQILFLGNETLIGSYLMMGNFL